MAGCWGRAEKHGGSSCKGRTGRTATAAGGGLARRRHGDDSCRGRTGIAAAAATVAGGRLRWGGRVSGFQIWDLQPNQEIEYIYPLKRRCFDASSIKTTSFWCSLKKNYFNWTGRFGENRTVHPVHRLDQRFRRSDPGSIPSRSN